MTLPDSYLTYEMRRYGMDHDLYSWSPLPNRPLRRWANEKSLALWVNLNVEWFPLNMTGKPMKLVGALERPYPDYWNYTHRDYGLQVGIYRLLRMVEGLDIAASVAINAAVANRHPKLVRRIAAAGHEILGHGIDMAHVHCNAISAEVERGWIDRSLATLQSATGQSLAGWLSPGRATSDATTCLLKEAGLAYTCDWPIDDLPVALQGPASGLYTMPHSFELDDLLIMHQYFQTPYSFAEQLRDQFEFLLSESRSGGARIISLTLNPWISGHPYRIAAVENSLREIVGHPQVWTGTGMEILSAWKEAPRPN